MRLSSTRILSKLLPFFKAIARKSLASFITPMRYQYNCFCGRSVVQSGCDNFCGCSQLFKVTGDLQLFCVPVMLLYMTEMNIWKEWIITVEVGSSSFMQVKY